METENMNNAGDVAMEPEASGPSKNERQWAMGCHLVALCGIVIPFPAVNMLAPLIIWLLKREDGAFIDDQGKESVNFQISLFIYALACGMLAIIGVGLLLLFTFGSFRHGLRNHGGYQGQRRNEVSLSGMHPVD